MQRGEIVAASVLGLVLALLWTWPLALEADSGVLVAPGSEGLRAGHHGWVWNLWHVDRALAGEGLGGRALQGDWSPTGVEHSPLLGLVASPLVRVLGPVGAANGFLWLLLAGGFVACFALLRSLGLRPLAAYTGALAWAMAPAAVSGALVSPLRLASLWAPLFALLLLRWMDAGPRVTPWRRVVFAGGTGLVWGAVLWVSPALAALLMVLGTVLVLTAPPAREGQTRCGYLGLVQADGVLAFVAASVLGLTVFLALAWPGVDGLSMWSLGNRPRIQDAVLPPVLHPLWPGEGKAYELFPGMVLITLALGAGLRLPQAVRWLVCAALLLPLPWSALGPPELGAGVALLPVAVAAAMGLEALLASGRRKLALSALVLLLFEVQVRELPLVRTDPPEAVRAIAALSESEGQAGAVCVVGHVGGAHAALGWQTVHGRPVLFGPAPVRWWELLRWGSTAPALRDFLLGVRIPDPESLAIDLRLEGVDHVLLHEAGREALGLSLTLDDMPDWERAETNDGVRWWYRARYADAVAQARAGLDSDRSR